MKKAKRLSGLLAVSILAVLPISVQAKSVSFNTSALLGPTRTVVLASETGAILDTQKAEEKKVTTVSSIEFAEGEFVRITQPSIKENMSTFETQLNLIFEARLNTKITVQVLYGDKNLKETSKTYEVKTVGATQTCNQVVDLKVGENTILITAVHESTSGNEELSFFIIRKSEQTKEALINYSVLESSLLNGTQK
jgi:hypothetical protein